ncbi:MAG TPA: MFS transporter [Chloroflexota bacterium]|nr:MFS transporter [Chloroflexota bacterium]
MKVQEAPQRAGTFSRAFISFHNYNFRLFWIGQLVSQIGTWMQIVALPWLVLQITHSSVALGTVVALQFVPILAVVLFAGVIVDRLPKQRLLIVTQSVSLAQALVLAVLTATGHIALWHIYLLAVVLGLINAFDNPARQSLVTELVGRDNLVNALGLSSAQFSSARLVGPALGGLVIGSWGIAVCFYLNALSFLAVLISLFLLHTDEFHAVPERVANSRMLGELKEGLRFLITTPSLAVGVIILCGNGAFIYSTSTVIPLIAQYELGVGATQFGLLVAAVGLGSVIMAVTLATHGKASQRVLLLSAGAFAALYLSLAFSTMFIIAFLQLVLVGGSIQLFATSLNSLLQIGSPDRLRGRMMAVFTLLTNGITPLGSLFAGFVTAAAGVRFALAGEGVICFVALGIALVYRARTQTVAAPVSL